MAPQDEQLVLKGLAGAGFWNCCEFETLYGEDLRLGFVQLVNGPATVQCRKAGVLCARPLDGPLLMQGVVL